MLPDSLLIFKHFFHGWEKSQFFPEANEEWLDYVVNNRRGLGNDNDYDLVIGPVANDSTLEVIDDYMAGRYDKRIAIELLEPQNLIDQHVFKSGKALEFLSYEKSEVL